MTVAERPHVWVVWIDLGQGVMQAMRAFGSEDAAGKYANWHEPRNGSRCHVAELPIEEQWEAA